MSLRSLVAAATGGGLPLGGGAPAVQTLTCSLAAGSLAFTSRWATSAAVAWDASPADLELAISNLATVNAVQVRAVPVLEGGAYTTPSSICSADAERPFVMQITFPNDAGAVPALVVSSVGIATDYGSVDVAVVSEGSLPEYGADPLSPATWDADMIQGCHCDGYPDWNMTSLAGDRGAWLGHACALRACPSGPDPFGGAAPVLEVQRLSCVATGGVFSLSFRGVSTPPLDYDTTTTELAGALEDLASVGLVAVAQAADDGSALVCGSNEGAPRVTLVTFLTELGDLPLLVADGLYLRGAEQGAVLPTLLVDEAVRGAATVRECAGQGTCDRTTGLCACSAGWLSSDGDGGVGMRGDCGARRTSRTP